MKLHLPPGHFVVNGRVVVILPSQPRGEPQPLPALPPNQRYFITSISLYDKERMWINAEQRQRWRAGLVPATVSGIIRCAIKALADTPPKDRLKELPFHGGR